MGPPAKPGVYFQLIKSLNLQNEANIALRDDLKNKEQTEKLRQFETQFFNMLNSQKTSFDSFKIRKHQKGVVKKAGDAVIELEEIIEDLRATGDSDKGIVDLLEIIDADDQLFSVTRRFYILAKMISEKLSDENGFSPNDRRSHLSTLINFTEFPLMRLLMMSMQFMDYPSVEYLKKNLELNSVLKEVGIGWDLY